jgi:hypothetical protein
MTSLIDQFVAAMGAALDWTGPQIAAVQTAADTYFPTTPSDLAAQITTFVANAGTRDANYNNYFAGTASGGPTNNGIYPITLFSGTVVYLPCPALLAQNIQRGADASTGINFQVIGPYNANEQLGSITVQDAMVIDVTNVFGQCGVRPTANTTFTLKKSLAGGAAQGVVLGTIAWPANSWVPGSATLSTNTLAQGDSCELWAGSTIDATLANFSINLNNGA